MQGLIQILSRLEAESVDYVVVGGFAAVIYGNPRVTVDIDICVTLSQDNLQRFADAINPLEPRTRRNGARIVLDSKPLGGEFSKIYTSAGELDIMHRLTGVESFQALRDRSVIFDLGAHPVRVAHIDDLIAMKEAAGRPHDMQDAANLRWLRDETARRAAQSPDA